MSFKANCSGDVSITVDATKINTGANNGIYFTVIIDGQVQHADKRIPADNKNENWTANTTQYPFHITKSGESTFTIAKALSAGNHTIEIYKQTEADKGVFAIKNITLNGSIIKDSVEVSKYNDLYIEFVGDSITSGVGNISSGSANNDSTLYQDATRGWPYLTAKNLKADWSIIAQSGITVTEGVGYEGRIITMPVLYPRICFLADARGNYSFARKADVVVINLGTNDIATYQTCGKSKIDVKNGFKKMMQLAKEKNPDAKIVWITGMMETESTELAKKAVEELGGTEKDFYTIEMQTDRSGGGKHPGLAVQEIYASKLSKYINDILNPSDVDTDLDTDEPEISTDSNNEAPEKEEKSNLPLIIGISAGAVILVAAIIVIIIVAKKKKK